MAVKLDPETTRVLVLSVDQRVLEASRALPPPFNVQEFADRVSFLTAAQDACDVAIVDLKAGGFAASKDLMAMPTTAGTALVMVCDRSQDRWICSQAGADAVLIKPLADTSTLTDAVKLAVNSRTKRP